MNDFMTGRHYQVSLSLSNKEQGCRRNMGEMRIITFLSEKLKFGDHLEDLAFMSEK